MLTLTMRHALSHSLADTLGAVRKGFSSLVAGKGWQGTKKDFGVLHYIRAHDCTHGANGWHPHLHILLFLSTPLSEERRVDLERSLFRRWRGSLEKQGFDPPSWAHGIRLEQARDRADVARYIMQVVVQHDDESRPRSVAMELLRGDLKVSRFYGQRTPWQIVEDLRREGDANDLELWHEWEQGTRNVRAVFWSHGFKRQLAIHERSDEEIAQENAGGLVVHTLTDWQWSVLQHTPGGILRILRIIESDPSGGSGVAFLEECRHRRRAG